MVKVGVTAYTLEFSHPGKIVLEAAEKRRAAAGATKRAEVVDEDAALAAGHRVLAKQVTEPHLGGLKTQASVDKKNAGIAAGIFVWAGCSDVSTFGDASFGFSSGPVDARFARCVK